MLDFARELYPLHVTMPSSYLYTRWESLSKHQKPQAMQTHPMQAIFLRKAFGASLRVRFLDFLLVDFQSQELIGRIDLLSHIGNP